MIVPADLDAVIEAAWHKARDVPGYLGELEFRALGLLAAVSQGPGVAVEIGSFKGKSTAVLASVRAHYGLGPVVSIDPHNAPSSTDPDLQGQSSSFDDFLATLRSTSIEQHVEVHRVSSRQAAVGWSRPIGFLWIDGDHTYEGAKEDLDLFLPFVSEGAVVAFHDTLHEFEGPIRVFVENMLRSDAFGPAGFLHTIGWAQYRPRDGARFRKERERLAERAARLIPFVARGREVKGLAKLRYKLRRALVPHAVLTPAEWAVRIPMSIESPRQPS
ncbi:MAG TPA: class I SAM-dependent methyltransferase [Terriglobia bacterium]|nr:class I SAM-dependent methyltransferase [Terriglobia bacterium]